MKTTTMTSKGQVTIPKEARDRARIGPGSRVEITYEDGLVVIRPVPVDHAAERDRRFAEAARVFEAGDRFPGMSTDEFMAMIREPVEEYAPFPAAADASRRRA